MAEEVKREKAFGAEAAGEGVALDPDAVEPEGSEEKADDYIDELALKDKEVDYTEEDLVRLRKETEELKSKGNELFKKCDYKEALKTYTLALRTCPLAYSKDRAVLFANRAAGKVKLELTDSALEDCNKAVELDPTYLRALLRRAQLNEKKEKLDEALEDYKKVLELDPANSEAFHAARRLPDQITERNEKLKTEMIGKLKDLGNIILKPFGLSTNNFEMLKDDKSGGYSFNFKQNSS